MNVSKGDLAIVVRAAPVHQDAIGSIVTVGEPRIAPDGIPGWRIRFNSVPNSFKWASSHFAEDWSLRRICPPPTISEESINKIIEEVA